MVTTIIVITSLALAAAFTLGWLLKPGLRAQIEAPKHFFQERVRQYDQGLENTGEQSGGDRDSATN